MRSSMRTMNPLRPLVMLSAIITCAGLLISCAPITVMEAPVSSLDEISQEVECIFATLDSHIADINDLRFSSDGLTLVSASEDNTIRLWDTVTGLEMSASPIQTTPATPRFITFTSPDTLAYVGYGQVIYTWSISSNEQVAAPIGVATSIGSGYLSTADFSIDGQMFFTGVDGSGEVHLWDIQSESALDHSPLVLDFDTINAAALSPDNRILAVGGVGGLIRLLDIETGSEISNSPINHADTFQLAFSLPDGHILAVGDPGTELRLWNITTGDELSISPLNIPEGGGVNFGSFAFHPEGELLATGGVPGKIYLWDLDSGAVVNSFSDEDSSWVKLLAFSPDGTLLASGHRDNSIRLWNTEKCITAKDKNALN